MMATKSTVINRLRRRWFLKSLLAMLLGMLAWLSVDFYLSPRPAWVLSVRDASITGGIIGTNEDNEWLFEVEPKNEPAPLVDVKSGTLKKRLNSLQTGSDYHKFFDGSSQLYGQTVWRLEADAENEPTYVKLYGVDNDNADLKQCIRTWQFAHPAQDGMFHITWGPQKTGLLLVQSFIPRELFAVTSPSPWGLFLPVNILLDKVLSQKDFLAFYQVWQLPKIASDGLSLVSSWTLAANSQHDEVSFSPDGTQLAIADECKNITCGALIFDIKTGQLAKKRATDVAVRLADFHGPYLFCNVVNLYPAYWKDMIEPQLSMASGHPLFDVKNGTRVLFPDSFPNPADMGTRFAVNPSDPEWAYIYSHVKFKDIGEVMDDWFQYYTILKRSGNKFEIQSQVKVPKRTGLRWLGQNKLLIGMQSVDPTPSFLAKLAEKNKWVNSIIHVIWPFDYLRTTIYDHHGEVCWQWDDANAVNPSWNKPNPDPTRLILARDKKGNNSYSRLECYTLPLKFYSLWWSRASGIVASLLVFLILFRRSRTVQKSSPR